MTPEGWRMRAFGELADGVVEPYQPDPSDTRPYVALEHIAQGEPRLLGWDRAGNATSTKAVFKASDLLFGKLRPNLRKAVLAPFDGVCSTDILVLRAKADTASTYLQCLAHWPRFQDFAVTTASGTKMPRTSWSLLRPFELAVPPLGEQKKIAAILSSVDEAIEATQAVIDQLQVVKKAMMSELLTRGLPGRHTRFKQTEIGEVPDEWAVQALSAYLREPIRNGYSPVCPTEPTGKWILHLGAVTFDGFNANAVKPAPMDDAAVDAAALTSGDLLVSRSNTRERVGLAGVYRGSPTPCAYPDLLMRVRTTSALRSEFLEAVLLSARVRRFLGGVARGTSESMVKINREALGAVVIPIPPVGEQEEIIAVIQSIEARRAAEQWVRATVLAMKAALMSVLLTGEVRVKPDEPSA